MDLNCPHHLEDVICGDRRTQHIAFLTFFFRVSIGVSIGGGKIIRYSFITLNVFVYISYWAAQVNSQNRLHFEGDYRN